MAFTQSDVDKLEAAIAASGSMSSMTFGGQTFTFRSIEEQYALLDRTSAFIRSAAGGKRTRYIVTDKGA